MLICDKCFSIFAVECGPPIGPYKLPPEYEITFSERKTESFGKIFREYDFAGNIKQFCVPLEDFDPNEDKKVVTKETPRPPFYLRVLSRLGINI